MIRIIFWTVFFALAGVFYSCKQPIIDIFVIGRGALIGGVIGYAIGLYFTESVKKKLEKKQKNDVEKADGTSDD